MNRVEIKSKAKSMIEGNLWVILKPIVIADIIIFVTNYYLSFLFDADSLAHIFITYILSLLEASINYGIIKYMIKFVRNENPSIGDLLAAKDNLLTVILVALLVSLFTILWSFLFIIPGIIAAISYVMVFYILVDNEKMQALEVVEASKKMMYGYKFDYFVFCLSFLGWIILIPITLGLILIWLVPYMSIAQVLYYENLKSKSIKD
jgi:uncharacterized membrane protein